MLISFLKTPEQMFIYVIYQKIGATASVGEIQGFYIQGFIMPKILKN
ncbi:hypothetical protein LEP1GSC046_3442 [Leptospira kirschneri serovar Bim str. 1051]|nr:hypothetical protein LEP1GSC046_3442 [Leptospira kirschneri serovar Bim str. 1051]